MFESLLPIAGSLLGGLFQDDAAQTQADATRAAAGTAAEAANPHLQWQKEVAIPYLTKILESQAGPTSPSNLLRDRSLAAVLPLLERLNTGGLPEMFDPQSRDAVSARRLRDIGMNELSDRADNPMKFASYRDREAASQLAMNSLTDPVSFLEGPYARFFDQAGEDAISRNAMAKGQGRSSALVENLHRFGGKTAEDSFQRFVNNLLSLAGQRGQNFTTDESSSLQAMNAGNAMLSALMDQASKTSGEADRNIKARLGTLSDIFNFGTAGKQDPFFDKLVSLAGGQPAAAAQAIIQGNKTAGEQTLGGTAALSQGLQTGLGTLYRNLTNGNNQSGGNTYNEWAIPSGGALPQNSTTSLVDWDLAKGQPVAPQYTAPNW